MAKTPAADAKKQIETTTEMSRLQRWNLWLAGIFAIIGLLVWLLSSTKTLPVQASYPTPDTVASEITGNIVWSAASRHLFDVDIAQLLAAACFIVAIGHLVAATIYRQQYEAGLKKRLNKVRWVAYGLSGGLAMVVVALLAGIAELSVLVLLFLLTALMCLLGLALELQNQAQRAPKLLLYVAGGVIGIVSWLVIASSVWAVTVFGSGSIAGFVYWIFGTMIVMHVLFAYTLYRTVKPGSGDYIRTERQYMLLGAITTLLLVVQVFRGVL